MNNIEQEIALWESVWDVLVQTCGANNADWERGQFLSHHTCGSIPEHTDEWVFQGLLGFGGKFLWRSWQFAVSFYPEDRTPEREQIKVTADAQLQPLFEQLMAIRAGRLQEATQP